jgi:hypothetical protein
LRDESIFSLDRTRSESVALSARERVLAFVIVSGSDERRRSIQAKQPFVTERERARQFVAVLDRQRRSPRRDFYARTLGGRTQ